jgi:uncharacterized protein (TIGR04168 family)
MTRLAVVGDVHQSLSDADIVALDAAGHDAILFVGDLPGLLHTGMRTVCERIARLRTPSLVMPGNHDGPSPLGILREALLGWHPPGSAARVLARTERIEAWLQPVPLVGYSLHPIGDLTVIAARPYAMDGRRVSFAGAVQARHGVATLHDSARRLCQLVDQAPTERLVFLAHNGPSGMGTDPGAPWVLSSGRDLGDPDLAEAVAYAGQRVHAVVAGHIHHGPHRRWHVVRDGVHYVNAAKVPLRGWHVIVDDAGVRAASTRSSSPT